MSVAVAAKPQYRSSEELEMRAIIVPELRKRFPAARIVHELPLRYSTNRIDLAAITEREIVSVEIKSSKDVSDRLEAQLRAFLPISMHMIVALAPKWNEQLPALEVKKPNYTSYTPQRTECQEIIERVGCHRIAIWTVDAAAGSWEETRGSYVRNFWPWHAKMLDMLHVAELVEVARQHRVSIAKRPAHDDIVTECVALMSGREISTAVCAALRARKAFGADSDPPMGVPLTHGKGDGHG